MRGVELVLVLTTPRLAAGEGGSWQGEPAAPAPGTAARSGTDTASARETGAGSDFGWGGFKKGWLKNASKWIRSLASRLRRFCMRWVNSGLVPTGIRGASRAFFS